LKFFFGAVLTFIIEKFQKNSKRPNIFPTFFPQKKPLNFLKKASQTFNEVFEVKKEFSKIRGKFFGDIF